MKHRRCDDIMVHDDIPICNAFQVGTLSHFQKLKEKNLLNKVINPFLRYDTPNASFYEELIFPKEAFSPYQAKQSGDIIIWIV